MKDLLQEVLAIRAAAERHQIGLASEYGVGEGGAPLGAFGMFHNDATMTFELLNFYDQLWRQLKAGPDVDIARVREENGERIINITRWFFVQSMSSIEYSAKAACSAADLLSLPGGRIYLRKIINASGDRDWIDAEDCGRWDRVVEVRNTVVHNNAIPDVTETVDLPNVTLELEEGTMIQGDLNSFVRLTAWSIDAFADWSRAFLERWDGNGK